MDRTSRRTAVAAAAAVAAVIAIPAVATAQETFLPDWKFGTIVYGWFPSAADRAARAEQEAGAEASHWSVTSGYASLGFDGLAGATGRLSLTAPAGHLGAPADAMSGAALRPRGWTWSLLGSYALVARPNSQMELLGGARYLNLATSTDGRLVRHALPGYALGASARESDAWDAVVGARGRYRFGESHRWFLPYYLDLGAGQSDFTWQAMGGIGYAFSWGEVFASYRHLDYRFSTDSRMRDLSFSGPGVTFGVRW